MDAALKEIRFFTINEHRQHPVNFFTLVAEKVSDGRICNVFDRQLVDLSLDDLGINGHVAVVENRRLPVMILFEFFPRFRNVYRSDQCEEVELIAIFCQRIVNLPHELFYLGRAEYFKV